MSINTGINVGSLIMLQRNGENTNMVTVTEVSEYITVKYSDQSTKMFIPIYDSSTFIDTCNGNEYNYTISNNVNQNGSFSINITLEQAISDPYLHNTAEEIIWRMLIGEVPSCNCPRCLVRQLAILESALSNVPDNYNCAIAAVFISEIMLPRILRSASNNIMSIINELISDDDDVLMRSMTEGGNVRHAASEETISKMTNFIKPYNRSIHGEHASCAFCLETFEDITKEQNGVPPLVVTCPGCKGKQSFCAGSKNSVEGCCKGFLGQMGVDHRCPCCRMSVRDWSNNEEPVKEVVREPSPNTNSNYGESIYKESYDIMIKL